MYLEPIFSGHPSATDKSVGSISVHYREISLHIIIVLFTLFLCNFSAGGTGDLYQAKQLKRFFPMNQMDHLLLETAVMIITYFH